MASKLVHIKTKQIKTTNLLKHIGLIETVTFGLATVFL